MEREILLAATTAIVVCKMLIPTAANAQTVCDSVLIGIHQSEYVRSDKSNIQSTLDILKKYEDYSFQQAKNTALDAGFTLPLEAIPIDFKIGYKSDSSGKGNWAARLEKYLSLSQESYSNYTRTVNSVNESVVKAWSDCISNRTGISAWPDLENDSYSGEFTLFVQHRVGIFDRVKIDYLEIGDQFEIISPKSAYSSDFLSTTSPTIIKLRRKTGQNKSGTIIVRTSSRLPNSGAAEDVTVKIRPFPQKNIIPLPPQPDQDFDGDRIRDTIEFTGGSPYKIKVTLGNGRVVETVLPAQYNPTLPQISRVLGDFNGDGATDLAVIVKDGAHYGHIHLSRGDGSFADNKVFDFRAHANLTNDYDTRGVWEVGRCVNSTMQYLIHRVTPGLSGPKGKAVFWWTPVASGEEFYIDGGGPQC